MLTDRPVLVRVTFLLLTPLLLGTVLVLVVLSRRGAVIEPDLAWHDAVRREVQAIVEQRYADPLTVQREEELFDGAMQGYVEQLDPFCRYFRPAERKLLEEDTTGTFGGIGIKVRPVPEGLVVTAVRTGGPADASGIVPGDVVEQAGATPLTGRDLGAMIDLIKGPPGSTVTLLVRRGAEPPRPIEVRRAFVDDDTVPSVRLFPGEPAVGYVRLSQFSESTPPEVRSALRSLLGRGAGAFIVDLRRNLGGVVTAAVDVASLFLPADEVVCVTRMRDRARPYRTAVKDDFEPIDHPLIVLVDGASASASEILAGALQDHGRAVLVGERTYGKFLVQSQIELSTRPAVVRLTTSRYETPRGRSNPRNTMENLMGGLIPDVLVALRTRVEQEDLLTSFATQSGPMWRVLPERVPSPDQVDPQLRVAIDLLRGGEPPAEPVPPRVL